MKHLDKCLVALKVCRKHAEVRRRKKCRYCVNSNGKILEARPRVELG